MTYRKLKFFRISIAKNGQSEEGSRAENIRGEGVKSFSVTAFFPEVKAHLAWQTAPVGAGGFDVAAGRGLKQLRARPGVDGKRINEVRVTIKPSETELK